MHRFFVDFTPVEGQEVALTGAVAHQVGRVLRLRPGATIALLDGSGREFTLELVGFAAAQVTGRVVASRRNEVEPSLAVTLYAAPLKGDHFAWTLQKCTEVGAAAFVPILTERTVAGGEAPEGSARLERWRRIVREAAEQARRGRLPPVHPPLRFADAVRAAAAGGPALIPWEEERARTLREVSGALLGAAEPPEGVSLFIGPEGGFSPGEVALAREQGLVPVTLGPRILRAETAALVATALMIANAERGPGTRLRVASAEQDEDGRGGDAASGRGDAGGQRTGRGE